MAGFKLFHEQVSYSGADGGIHYCTMDLFIILTLGGEKGILKTEFQQCDDVLYRHGGPVFFSCMSCCTFCLITEMAGYTGTDVKRAFTS